MTRIISVHQRITAAIAWLITHGLMVMVYFGVLTPTAWCVRWFRDDPLRRRWGDDRDRTNWQDHDAPVAGASGAGDDSSPVELPFWLDLVLFLRESKKWWLIPLLVSLLAAGFLSLLPASPAAPFIYALF